MTNVVSKIVSAEDQTVTFKLLRTKNVGMRYTAFLVLCNQSGNFVGMYAIGVNMSGETINRIGNSSTAVLSRSADNVTITFSSSAIWTDGLLFAPIAYC